MKKEPEIRIRILGQAKRVKVPIRRLMSLHGIPGFALHESHSAGDVWTVSHIETGSRVSGGATQRIAEMRARQVSKNAKVLKAGIEVVKALIRDKGKK
jgi:hypothetical protein